MKIKRNYQTPLHALVFQPTTIARFGPARLIKHFDGPYELIGGTPADQAAAREWCSLFAPEVVFSDTPRSKPAVAFAVQIFSMQFSRADASCAIPSHSSR